MDMLRLVVSSGRLPHLVIHGPAGCGKSTAVLALANEMYGEDYERNLTYFNASDFFDQGKRYLVRDKRFIRFLGTDDPKKIQSSVISIFKDLVNEYAAMGSLDADYKIIFIDSAESLREDAQHALRRIMERYSKTCRFVFSTTQPSRLISPLRSRGLELFFTYVGEDEFITFLKGVAEAENLDVSDDAWDNLYMLCKGNIACGLNILQTVSLESSGKVDTEMIFTASQESIPAGVRELYRAILKKDLPAARKAIDPLLIRDGMSGVEVISHLHKVIWEEALQPEDIAAMLRKLSDADLLIRSGASDRIQLEALVTEMANV
ncbi:replication factor C small subunit [Methanohalophilus levihalophilus]|nr:replication factor C small subunit [Methanohalophilus levihalophilus]